MVQRQSNESQIFRIPLVGPSTIGDGNTKGRLYTNGIFESIPNVVTKELDHFFVKRPGLTTLFTPSGSAGPGRGIKQWSRTNKLYSVNGNKIYSNATDIGITLTTTQGICGFAETRPGATPQYLGVNDGSALYLIGTDDSVIVMNNVAITSSSVANPTTITANNHGLATGNKIIIRGHVGSTPNINNTIYTITKTGTNTFTIPVNVTVGGTGGTIGSFPAPNTSDLEYMDGYWFTLKQDNTIFNCAVDDPTTWADTSFLASLMQPGNGVGLGRQNNVLLAFSDRHLQMFFDNANPVGSPLANVEQAMQQVGCVASNSIAAQENTVYWVSNTLNGGFTVYRLDGTANLKDIGTPQLNRSIVQNVFSLIGGTPQTIVLTSGTSWTVPADFNAANNTIEAIGGGAGGHGGQPGFVGDGGGGGAYAKISNFNPAGAASIGYSIGIGGGGGVAPIGGQSGGQTTFNTSSLIAKGGNAGVGGAGGLGGTAAASTGTVKFSGGNGGVYAGFLAGGGGGGAAGKQAAGENGQNAQNNSTPGHGGQGDPPLGGSGGIGAAGGNGGEWITAGSGGGGAGGFQGDFGKNGGNYGAAGGGGGEGGSAATDHGGNGSQGVIVITYTPAIASANTTISAYILRISGHIYYVLNLLSAGITWVYDQDLGIWIEWTSGSGCWPVLQATQFAESGQPYTIVGQDATTGKIYQIATSIFQDDGVSFPVEIQSMPFDLGNKSRKFYTRIELIGDKQTASTPVLISYSDDDYTTFSSPRTFNMQDVRPYSMSWGNSRRRVIKISYTGNGPLRLFGIELELRLENQ